MNKLLILISGALIIVSLTSCKSFRTYFNPAPKKKNPEAELIEAELIEAEREAKLTPHQKRQRQLKNTVFGLKPDKGATKSNLNSSLNSYEQQYLNEYYKEQDSKKKRNIFKLF
ncbi:MAG: hypothetical protein L3J71_01935 [Victivallaceae bacterium]|nr:hypothetical protein [Victivallaceae bacterium]